MRSATSARRCELLLWGPDDEHIRWHRPGDRLDSVLAVGVAYVWKDIPPRCAGTRIKGKRACSARDNRGGVVNRKRGLGQKRQIFRSATSRADIVERLRRASSSLGNLAEVPITSGAPDGRLKMIMGPPSMSRCAWRGPWKPKGRWRRENPSRAWRRRGDRLGDAMGRKDHRRPSGT